MTIHERLVPKLEALPRRGWGVLRDISARDALLLAELGACKLQLTPTAGVYQARLLGFGRRYVRDARAKGLVL